MLKMTTSQFFLIIANIWICSAFAKKQSGLLVGTIFGILYLSLAIFFGVEK